jgi:PAS domain S-box-containing protein
VRESEERFRLVADTAPVLIWMSGPDKLCTYFNKPWLDFTGRSRDSELGNGWAEGVHPEDLQRCLDTYTQSFDRREKFRMEYRLRHRDGEYRWILDVGVPRFNEDGSFAGYIGIGVDVNEGKWAEDKLRESEERYRDLAEQSRTTNWEVDPQGLFTYVSHVSQASWGYRPDEVLGRMHFYDLHPTEGSEAFKAAVFAVVERKQPFRDVVHAIETKDGRISWGSTNGVPLLNGDGTLRGYRGSCTDITERRQAEEAVRASEERLRLAQQIARIGTFEWNAQTGVNTWTPELEAMYGLQPGTFTGTQAAFENLVHVDDRAGVINLVDRALKTGQSTEGEWRVVWADGSVHWIAGRWQVLMNESREPVRMIGVNIDVTQRKRAEEALLEVNRRLIEAQEQERTRIGRELHDDIGQRLAMLAIELQQLHEDPVILPEVRIRMSALQKRISEIANDIQSLSHELHSAKLQYLGIAAAMRGFCQEFEKQQKVEIDFKAHDLPSPLSPDISLCLFRVLQESLHNAAKHSGVWRFEVQLWGMSGDIHLTVRDSGAGFDQKAAKESRGLGLISMEERLKLLKGTFSIESQPKRGTTIHARVPLSSGTDSMRAAG